MRSLIFGFVVLLSFPLHALQFIKCGSVEGKTLYATFGKRVTSGVKPSTVYFPIEFTVFAGPKTLQDRIIYYRTKDALKIPLQVSEGHIAFSFKEKSLDGQGEVTESLNLGLISPKDLRGFMGGWKTTDENGQVVQSVTSLCSVYQ